MNLSVKETSNQNQKKEIWNHIFEHIGDSDCYLTWRNEVNICSAYYAQKAYKYEYRIGETDYVLHVFSFQR